MMTVDTCQSPFFIAQHVLDRARIDRHWLWIFYYAHVCFVARRNAALPKT
jgi:hypothetical protein